MLLSGADRLRTSQNELTRNRNIPDFHIELLRLRQSWRLKKVSNSIIGDLSYRTGEKICIMIVMCIIDTPWKWNGT